MEINSALLGASFYVFFLFSFEYKRWGRLEPQTSRLWAFLMPVEHILLLQQFWSLIGRCSYFCILGTYENLNFLNKCLRFDKVSKKKLSNTIESALEVAPNISFIISQHPYSLSLICQPCLFHMLLFSAVMKPFNINLWLFSVSILIILYSKM